MKKNLHIAGAMAAVLALAFCLVGCVSSNESQPTQEADQRSEVPADIVIEVTTNDGAEETLTPDQLVQAYEENEVSAKKKYFMASAEFTAAVTDIQGATNSVGHEMAGFLSLEGGIRVEYSSSDRDLKLVESISKGDLVTVRGAIYDVSQGVSDRIFIYNINDSFNEIEKV